MRGGAVARVSQPLLPLCQAQGSRRDRRKGAAGVHAEEEAAVRRRLRRRPLVLTTHAQERLLGR